MNWWLKFKTKYKYFFDWPELYQSFLIFLIDVLRSFLLFIILDSLLNYWFHWKRVGIFFNYVICSNVGNNFWYFYNFLHLTEAEFEMITCYNTFFLIIFENLGFIEALMACFCQIAIKRSRREMGHTGIMTFWNYPSK